MSFALQQKWGKWSARPVAKLAASKEIRQTVWANREVLSEAAAGQLPAALSWDPRERRGFPCSGYERMSLSTEFIPQTKTMSHPSPWFPSSTDSVDFILLFLFFSPSTKFPPFFFFWKCLSWLISDFAPQIYDTLHCEYEFVNEWFKCTIF